jgi:N,N'-diacetyllegionaminate synthase
MKNRISIIAEAGVNHNGDLSTAKKLIEIAAEAKADFVKFQTYNTSNLVIKDAKKAKYQEDKFGPLESQYAMLSRLELRLDFYDELISHAKKFNIGFLSTAFDIPSLNFLLEKKQQIFKIPSGEITNLPFLRYIGKLRGEVILSTGASNMSEIGRAVEILETSGTEKKSITVLHCTSAYPTPYQEVNLKAMKAISKEFGVKVGYSDHTMGIEVSIAAAALGASIIEKHFTINKSMIGPDHKMSLDPNELKQLVLSVRNIESSLGTDVKYPTKSELENLSVVRKSICAIKFIKKGDTFSEENITCKRPGFGLSPMKWDEVIGKKAGQDFLPDQFIVL